MEGLITKGGLLQIVRRKHFEPQACPFTGAEFFCGDWCPLFSEPRPEQEVAGESMSGITMKSTGKTIVSLCKKEHVFEKWTDERNDEAAVNAANRNGADKPKEVSER